MILPVVKVVRIHQQTKFHAIRRMLLWKCPETPNSTRLTRRLKSHQRGRHVSDVTMHVYVYTSCTFSHILEITSSISTNRHNPPIKSRFVPLDSYPINYEIWHICASVRGLHINMYMVDTYAGLTYIGEISVNVDITVITLREASVL